MGVPSGPFYIDDTLTFTAITHRFDTGALTDADAVPAYRIYEDETGTAILTGNTAKLDDASTTGFYSEQITLSAANGFEVGKSYAIYVTATVNSVVGGQSFNFKVIATPTTPPTAASIADAVWDEAQADHVGAGTFGVTASEIADILVDTAVIGAAGAGLSAVPWNAAWDVQVESEVADALAVYDPPTKAELDAAVANVSVDEIQATALADLFNTDSGTTYASAVAGSVVKEIADNAGGSSLTAADIADAVWDEDATGHQSAGTFGLAIGDPGASSETLYKAIVTDPAGTNIAADIIAIKAETAAILDDTDDIGVAGAGLTAINLPDQTMNITGNITGNLSGSVGSVTGAVGSVTGAVGSVTGLTNATIADAVWDEVAGGHQTQGTFGQTLGDSVADTASVHAYAAASYAHIDTTVVPTVGAIVADTNELQGDWVNGGRLDNILDARASQTSVDDLPTNSELNTALGTADDAVLSAIAALNDITAAEVADAVWLETLADHSGSAGSTAAALNAAGSAGDPWQTALPGAYGAGTAGKIVGDNINAPLDVIDTVVDAIKAKTDSLTFTVAGQVDANIESVNGTTVTGSGTEGDPWGP
jgi:hypothetical protein